MHGVSKINERIDGAGVIVITPTYNEQENIPLLIAGVLAALPAAHIIVVDDHSPDGTGAIVEQIAVTDDRVHFLSRPVKEGIGAAYLAGFAVALEMAECTYIVCMDADGSHDPVSLPRFLAAMASADMVVGTRHINGGAIVGWGPLRRFISWMGNLYARLILGVRYHDMTAGYRCIRRRALERICAKGILSEGYAFQIELTYRAHCAGMTIVELPICFVDRHRGASKLTGEIVLEAIYKVWQLKFSV
jgi:dolichol-phosphate mannosyltransferase